MYLEKSIRKSIPKDKLSVVILTYNEEANIGRVLDRLAFVDNVIILDSFSTDKTMEIVNTYPNTRVYTRTFDTHASQWNYGLDLCDSRWVLSLDADYVLPTKFVEELHNKINQEEFAAFDAQFAFLVFGKPLRRNNTTPRPVLFQKEFCRYYDDGHTQRLDVDGKTGRFESKIDHDDRKPLDKWLRNQASYSLKEANMLMTTQNDKLLLISKIRKKRIVAPFLVFFHCLFVQGLILDGWRGWYYTLQRTIVEMLFALRLIEADLFTIKKAS